jgi:Glycosyl transferase family 2
VTAGRELTSAPIILFTYNRPEHTRQTVEALKKNIGAQDSLLYVYSDGAKDGLQADAVQRVRAYLDSIDGFKSVEVVERKRNMGLAASVISGVSEVLERHSRAIVVEDDLLSAPGFLLFMNSALCTYQSRREVFSVTGYNYPLPIPANYPDPAYLSYRGSSWGWGTWVDRWRLVDWQVNDFADLLWNEPAQERFARGGYDLLPMLRKQMSGEIDSWAIRFDYAHAKNDAYCLHPIRSMIRNIGFDGSGIHCSTSNAYDVELDQAVLSGSLNPDLAVDEEILRIFNERFCPERSMLEPNRGILRRIGRRISRAGRFGRKNG